VALAQAVLHALSRPGEIALPRFDKARDDRRPPETWDRVEGPVDVILFEGWCLGVPPQPEAALAEPVNPLERDHDPDGRWRGWVNAALAREYQQLWSSLDVLVLLQAPSFDEVLGWRLEAERNLRARTGRGMSDEAVATFVAHYERLTRWALETLPARADVLVELAPDRTPSWVRP
jgi:D-glycerate 3-kinase